VAFLLPGKRKSRFSLSLQINDLRRKPLICAPVHGRDDDFLRSHHVMSCAISAVYVALQRFPSFTTNVSMTLIRLKQGVVDQHVQAMPPNAEFRLFRFRCVYNSVSSSCPEEAIAGMETVTHLTDINITHPLICASGHCPICRWMHISGCDRRL